MLANVPSETLSATRVSTARPVTASTAIRDALREQIVSVQMKPGAPLVEKELAVTFGVSRTPVREALLRLADEHLVDIWPQSGTFVSRIDLALVRDAMVIRQALERVSVREAAARAQPRDIARLRRTLQAQRDKADEPRGFHEGDEALHEAIAAVANHPFLWNVIRREKAPVDRFRLLTLPLPGRVDRLIGQHTRVVDAIAAHDADAAERAMQVHLLDVMPGFEALADVHPEFFTSAPRVSRRARSGAS